MKADEIECEATEKVKEFKCYADGTSWILKPEILILERTNAGKKGIQMEAKEKK